MLLVMVVEGWRALKPDQDTPPPPPASTSHHYRQCVLAPVRLHYTITHHNTAILLPSHRRFHQLYLVLLFRTKLTPFMAVSAGHLQHCSIKYSKGKGRSARRQCRQCSTWGLHSTHHTVPCSNPRNLALYPPLLLSTSSTEQHGQQRHLLIY